MVKVKENDKAKVVIQTLSVSQMVVRVRGVELSSFISHRLTKENVDKFVARETGKSKKNELRDFDAEYESCFYYTEDGKHGIPAAAFMSAMLQACTDLEVAKTQIKSFHPFTYLLNIIYIINDNLSYFIYFSSHFRLYFTVC